MDPLTGAALVSGAINAATSIFGGGNSAKANRRLQEDAQRFTMAMRRTQYQTTVEDMKKAGLNPMMLAMGSGLSQGMNSPMAQGGQLGEGIQKAGSKASETVMQIAQLRNMNSATELNKEMANKAIQDAALVHTQIGTEGAKAWAAQMANDVERQRLGILLDNMAKQGMLTDAQRAQIYADMGLNDSRKNALDASSAASYASAAADRAGLPSLQYKNSAFGIFMDELNRSAKTVADYLPTPKQGAAEAAKYRRARVYQNP